VAELFLHGADIRTRFEQVRGKRMAGDLFFNSRLFRSPAQSTINIRFIDMMSPQQPALRIDRKARRREKVLPAERTRGFNATQPGAIQPGCQQKRLSTEPA